MNNMAIVKVKFVRKGAKERAGAKANIRYIQNRCGRDGAKISRTLFGNGGKMERLEAYRMIDEAEPGSTFFKVIINFDAKTEDTQRDLNHREITERVIRTIAKELNLPVAWVAAFHDDHTPLRHIHALAVVKARRLPVVALRQEATQACLEQRRERDHSLLQQREKEQGKEGEQWERERSK